MNRKKNVCVWIKISLHLIVRVKAFGFGLDFDLIMQTRISRVGLAIKVDGFLRSSKQHIKVSLNIFQYNSINIFVVLIIRDMFALTPNQFRETSPQMVLAWNRITRNLDYKDNPTL